MRIAAAERIVLATEALYSVRTVELSDKVVIVTGGGNGIGRALVERFVKEGARVVAGDIDPQPLPGALVMRCDVSREDDIGRLIHRAETEYGPVDLYCSNAGIGIQGGAEVVDSAWQAIWNINVMPHVWAARNLVPKMLGRTGGGYFLITASAAGLLTQIGSAPYAVTKHAALAFAEWLSVTYGDRGIGVSALCPQGVKTNMLADAEFGVTKMLRDGAIEPEVVAQSVVEGIGAGRFLILPHPEVSEYFQRKAADPDRWIRGMRRLQEKVIGGR